jgi:hypothetical protein
MPCETCISIGEKIAKAISEDNPEKERVMRVLLENHQKQSHSNKHNVVAVDPEYIIWPNGVRWEVVK